MHYSKLFTLVPATALLLLATTLCAMQTPPIQSNLKRTAARPMAKAQARKTAAVLNKEGFAKQSAEKEELAALKSAREMQLDLQLARQSEEDFSY